MGLQSLGAQAQEAHGDGNDRRPETTTEVPAKGWAKASPAVAGDACPDA